LESTVPSPFADPALTVALALAAGMLAQSLARHLRIPGIVLLLAIGVLLGPDVLDAVRPGSLGHSLHTLVGFAVAVILFEGGMNLNLERLRLEKRVIRQLMTAGALVTAVGGALAARWILGWGWTLAVLFGTLVMVTGPTVITPLLRRIKVKPRVATVLEAEGVLVDAIGAIVAVVALEVAISPTGPSLGSGAWNVAARLGFGALLGMAAGFGLAGLLRIERFKVVPDGLESTFTLAFAVALFQVSNAVLPETGIVAVVAAGMVVGNSGSRVLGELREFKEKLTVLLIGLLFVLLAADVRMSDVAGLGWRGFATVLALMFVVRPLNVLVGTAGSDLTWREKAFLSWLAPRGIVAAAVSALFAQTLLDEGVVGGASLRALVFLVIAVTVVVQGSTGGLVAGLLGVRRPANTGYAILGANHVARALAKALRSAGEEAVLIDSNQDAVLAAREEGLRVLHGSGLDEEVQVRADLDLRAGCLGLTSNEEVNLLFARRALKDYHAPRVWVALRREHLGVSAETVHRLGGHVLFGQSLEVQEWSYELEHGRGTMERWRLAAEPVSAPGGLADLVREDALLPLLLIRGRKVRLVDERVTFRRDDVLCAAVRNERRAAVEEGLRRLGWTPAAIEEPAVV
jgi:NhaP-type Na+/H+ or K+/H+ antiporter